MKPLAPFISLSQIKDNRIIDHAATRPAYGLADSGKVRSIPPDKWTQQVSQLGHAICLVIPGKDASPFHTIRAVHKMNVMAWRCAANRVFLPVIWPGDVSQETVTALDAVLETLKPDAVLTHGAGASLLAATSKPIHHAVLMAADLPAASIRQLDHCATITAYTAHDDDALKPGQLGRGGVILGGVRMMDSHPLNRIYDPKTGHRYFLSAEDGQPGLIFLSLLHILAGGRPKPRVMDYETRIRYKVA